MYDADAVGVVRFIKRAQELGFTLTEIETLLQLAEGGPQSCEAARQLASDKIAELDRRLQTLQTMRDALGRLLATCSLPRSERDCPLLCAIGDA
jgi:DNA-binding transcriptional MerR regulator